MYTVRKDNRTMRITQEVQLDAFLKSGWELENSNDLGGVDHDYGKEKAERTDEEILEGLKVEADSIGLRYHPNIGYEKLFEKVKEYKSEQGLE